MGVEEEIEGGVGVAAGRPRQARRRRRTRTRRQMRAPSRISSNLTGEQHDDEIAMMTSSSENDFVHESLWRVARQANDERPHEERLIAQQRPLVAELRVDSLSSEDNGLYKCRVDFRRARSRIEESELRIVGEYSEN